MLVSFPIAFYTATLFSFIVYAVGGDPFWFRAGYASNVAGVVMAALAAVPGFIDWSMGIPSGIHAKSDGAKHMALNVTALVIFAINLWMNSGQWDVVTPVMRYAILLPLVGWLVTVTAGWFGWKMVQTHHVGVELAPEEEHFEERRRAA
jgi:uncharacterized membrane protein